MTSKEMTNRNKAALAGTLAGGAVAGLMIYAIGYAASIAAPVFFVIVGAAVRANILHKLDLNPEVY